MAVATHPLYLSIPATARSLEGFRRWCQSDDFPEVGRIDFLVGDLEVDMSAEDLYTHGVVKAEIVARLQSWISHRDLGSVFADRTRVTHAASGVSVEPDVVVVLWRSIEEGSVQEVPAASGEHNRFIELEGAPDLVVEILSDTSTEKDVRRTPPLLAEAGVPELWLIDARGEEPHFEIRRLEGSTYREVSSDDAGWRHSSLLSRALRLLRRPTALGRWRYSLEDRP
jgi:Uma2 family endonuclease